MKILVMANPPEAARIHAALTAMAQLHCRVHAASTLEEGLEALADWAFNLILLDLSLPDSTGMATLDAIRAAVDLPMVIFGDGLAPAMACRAARHGALGIVRIDRLNESRFYRTLWFALAHKQQERHIGQKERKFRHLIENLRDAYYEIDTKGNFTYVNNRVLEHQGRTREQLIGMNNREYTSAETAKQTYKAFLEVYQTGKSGKLLNQSILKPDGTTIDVELCISLIRDEAGKPVGFSGISRDVTDKLAALRALRLSEERYRNILENIEDIYFEVDLQGRMQFFNRTAKGLYGYSLEELRTMDHRSYMDKQNADWIYKAYHEIYKTGVPKRDLQYEVVYRDGTREFIESSVSLMRDVNGRPIGFRGVGREIMARKAFELELAKAKENAESGTKAKSEFLANISHEIRTPMNGIIGMYNLLKATHLTPEQTDFVEAGTHSAERLMTVINDILDFSKIEAGKLDMEIIDFDLRRTIDDMITAPALRAQAKGLEIVYQIDPEVPAMLKGDPGRLRQAIMNLLDNAIRFTPKGEVGLFVSLEGECDHETTIRFKVKDTGIGISRGDRKRLFRSFQQVDTSSTRQFGGSGLGLAITKRLADMMGGRLAVESRKGAGSLFWFNATFDKADDTSQAPRAAPATVRAKRILIVDDNKTNLDILEGYLKLWGCDCDRAEEGATALYMMQAVVKSGAPYDLVISDMVIPNMDGAELGRRIKADGQLKNTLLVMLTSQGLRGDAVEMKHIGFSAYLTKPVRPSQLYDCLVAVLSRGGQTHPPVKADLVTSHTLSEAKRSKTRILLADDNGTNRKIVLHLLKRFGFSSDAVADGQEALTALSKWDYDLVLMDIQMPGMDGLEATAAIRDPGSGVRNSVIPVVAMTAEASLRDRDRCLAAGMNAYINKPIQPDELLRTIEKMIGRKDER